MAVPVPNPRLEHYLPHLELAQTEERPKPTHDQEVLFDQWGLLDFSMFEPYRNPATYPENSTPWYLNGSGWDFHHALFSKGKYKKHFDEKIVWLRAGPYYQVPMDRNSHDQFHWDHVKDVNDSFIDIHAADRYLREAHALSRYGMAVFMASETVRLREETTKMSKKDTVRLAAKLAIFNQFKHEAKNRVHDIEVIPRGVVNYAVAGYDSYALPEQPSIKAIVESNSSMELTPVKLKSPRGLSEMGKVALNSHVRTMNWAVRRLFDNETAITA